MSRPVVVTALLLTVAMAAMEATVVATAMPTIVADVGGVRHYGWIASAYLLASTVTVPLYGKLADSYGRKPVMLAGIALFVAGSSLAGLARGIGLLVAARAIQGVGAGGMQPVTLTIVGDLYSLEERGKVQGVFGAVWAAAGVLGPLLGALLVHALSWRWVFWVNVPFGLAAMAVLSSAYREERERGPAPRLDGAGAALLVLASLAALAAAAGTAPLVLGPAASVLVLAFVAVERRAPEPLLPLALLARRDLAVAALATACLGGTMMGALTYLPLYVQGALGRSPAAAGATIAPMLLGWPLTSTLSTKIMARVGYRTPVWLGSTLVAGAYVALAIALRTWHAVAPIYTAMFFVGAGMGLAVSALLIAAQSSVGWERRGVVTATNMFARTMGGTLAVGALGAALAASLSGHLDPERVRALLDPELRRAGAPVDAASAAALGSAIHAIVVAVAALAVANLGIVAFYPRLEVTPRAPSPR